MLGWTENERTKIIDGSREKLSVASWAAVRGDDETFEVALRETKGLLGLLTEPASA